jgi:hypothetical protein
LAGGRVRHVAQFYDKYYSPAWTVIPALASQAGEADRQLVDDALGMQAMAMFLHLIDDHLVDGDIPVTHLFLQLRTEAWTCFADALDRMTEGNPAAREAGTLLVERYFFNVHRPPSRNSLAEYESVFTGEAATWMIAPFLIADRAGYSADRRQLLRHMYEEFCLAWRVLDDLRDALADAVAGHRTAVHHLLTPSGKAAWNACRQAPHQGEVLLAALQAGGYEAAVRTIDRHLEHAEEAAAALGLGELAVQYRALARPLKGIA